MNDRKRCGQQREALFYAMTFDHIIHYADTLLADDVLPDQLPTAADHEWIMRDIPLRVARRLQRSDN